MLLPSAVQSNAVTSVGEQRRLRDCTDFPRRDVGDEDVRRVVEVRDVGDLLAVGRPRRADHDRALRRLDRARAPLRRIDQREADAAARRQRPRAIRLGVDLQAAKSIVRLAERLDRRQPFALGLEELLLVRARVRERDVVARRRHDPLDVAGGLTYVSFARTSLGFHPC